MKHGSNADVRGIITKSPREYPAGGCFIPTVSFPRKREIQWGHDETPE